MCQSFHRLAVVFLIQEEAGLLTVFHIHPVADAVFGHLRDRLCRRGQVGQGVPALHLLHPLQLSDGHIVPLVDASDVLA